MLPKHAINYEVFGILIFVRDHDMFCNNMLKYPNTIHTSVSEEQPPYVVI